MGDHRLAPSTLIAALDARAQHRRQSHGGVVVHWREWGQGPPLVLLHWVHNIGHWSQHFRVIVPDLPGFGDSQDFALAAHEPARLECLLQVLQQGIETLVPHGGLHVAGFSSRARANCRRPCAI